MTKAPITVAHGDGIGPEIMDATLRILDAAGAELELHTVELGEKAYLRGCQTGIEDSTWETIRGTRAILKAPITTPQGGGFKSLNVTLRTALGLYANVRPAISYAPFIATKHPDMNVVIVRENEEELYTGIEYRQTPDTFSCLKVMSRSGSEKIIRFAFEYAIANGRKKVTSFTKDNIMKITDGMFHKTYDEIAEKYPQIESEHWIIDIGTAKLADSPENFDVIVLQNLYGDVLSDIAAQISGSVGLAGSANIGESHAMFEAIHGSAPRRAGQNLANPSGLLQGAILMLVYLGQADIATAVQNAWLTTIEQGTHTYDIFREGTSKKKVGTKEFADAVIGNLGKTPSTLPTAAYKPLSPASHTKPETASVERALIGVDIFIYDTSPAEEFVSKFTEQNYGNFELRMITNRGARIYPDGQPETYCIDSWRCRFAAKSPHEKLAGEIAALLTQLAEEKVDVIKTEYLYTFNGEPGYSNAEF